MNALMQEDADCDRRCRNAHDKARWQNDERFSNEKAELFPRKSK
jgi:hypothetical protein